MEPQTLHEDRILLVPGPDAASNRETGLRRLRHVSNWTIAALVVGVGAASALFARTVASAPATAPAPAATAGATAGAGGPSPATANASGSSAATSVPRVSAPVAATTPSGVVISPSSSGAAAGAGGTAGAGSTAARHVYAGGDT